MQCLRNVYRFCFSLLYKTPDQARAHANEQGRLLVDHYRTLFINNSDQSRKAIHLLTEKKIAFLKAPVETDSREFRSADLPLLITDEGRWKGLSGVERYVEYTIKACDKTREALAHSAAQ